MRALRTLAPERMELEEVERPADPGPDEALLRIEAVGICGSDYALFRGTHPLSQFPAVQGHEFCATVTGLGDGDGPAAVGERVAVEPLLPCGECYPCSLGRGNCCVRLEIIGVHRPGALQEELVVPRRLLHPVGDLPAAVAAFAEPLSIGLQAIRRGEVGAADSVLVIGAGPIGLAATMAARAAGARVAVTDPVAERRPRAEACGAELVLDAGPEAGAEAIEWSGGEGPTVVVDAAGAPATVRLATELVAAAGRVVVVGISTAEAALPIAPLTRKEMTILGSRNSAGIFGDAVALAAANRERIEPLITQRIGLEEVEATIGLALSHPERVMKAVVEP